MKTNTLRFTSALLFIGATAFFVSCAPTQEVEKLTFLHKIQVTNEDTTDGSQKFEGDAHGGKYFSHTDSVTGQYGSGTNFSIPDSLLQKTLRVKVNVWVKQGDLNEKNQLAVSLESGEGGVLWQSVSFRSHVSEINKWTNVNDSITIPGDLINRSGLLIKIFPYNPETTSYLDVDDEEISIYKVDKVIAD